MQRYFIPGTNWNEGKVIITGDDAHHITRVMRSNREDEIICVHPSGKPAICRLMILKKDEIEAEIVKWLSNDVELPVEVTILQGLPKGNKLEFILQKGTELGAHHFSLFEADRSIVKWNRKKSDQKIMRYHKIIKEASEQCHRNRIPTIEEPSSLREWMKNSTKYDIRLFAYEEEAKKVNYSSFASALKGAKEHDKIIVAIGPEGGFSEEEALLLKYHQFIPVRLGPRILRTETASMYALSALSYYFEELGWEK